MLFFATKDLNARQLMKDTMTTAAKHTITFLSGQRFRPSFIFAALVLGLSVATTSIADSDANTPRWYRYYDHGVPMLSSSVSEQHLSHGYDVLNRHMEVIRHVAPFSTERYDREEGAREQSIEKRIAARHLLETYISSDRAILQQNRELSDMDSQIQRAEQTTKQLNTTLNTQVSQAANYERQGQPIPKQLQKQLASTKKEFAQSQTNLASLKSMRDATSKRFTNDIRELKQIESQNRRAVENTPSQ